MNRTSLKYFAERFTGPVYFGFLLVNIIGGLFVIPFIQVVTKPFLMPLLMLCVSIMVQGNRKRNIILLALFFSWAGDCLLLFESQWPSLFIPGLLCFLLTHILYILYFLSNKFKDIPALESFPLLTALCILYGIFFLNILFPVLGSLKIPVTVYAVFILSMLLSMLYVYNSLPTSAGQFFVAGSLLFVLSDSILAFNKFLMPLGSFAIAIMGTYGFAQWFFVRGFIKMQG